MGNPIIHIEVAGRDGPALESFYSNLFGWKIDHRGNGDYQYGFLDADTAGSVGGGIRHEPEGKAEIVFYVQVPVLNDAIEKARSLGATVRIEPVDTGEVTFALINDPEGNPVGLIESSPQE